MVVVDLSSRSERSRRPLSAMTNYDTIAHHFPDPLENNGLEGITVNSRNNNVVVVKERQPGLLIEVDSTLTTILSTRVLQPSQGFMLPELKAEKLDFSSLSDDSSNDTLWIVSDRGAVPVPVRLGRRHCSPAPRSHHQHGRQAKADPQNGGCCLRSREEKDVRGERSRR